MNRSALLGFLAGVVLVAAAGLLLVRMRPAPTPERPAAGEPVPLATGRYQLVSSIEVLMLDTATGELWFHRHGKWHRAAGAPHDDGDRSLVLGEPEGRERAASEPTPPPEPAPQPAAAAEDRGRAEVIQVESAPEPPPRPARRPARNP
ncbi:MAG: hypothetical protein HZB56_23685 [Deltaproteobacteria bacterium]|nr:hypothetical protein [Deltaproteobacteria bacterium]